MASESPLAKLYFAIEDFYYSLMSAVNKVLPVYQYFVIPVERRGLPSLLAFVLLLAFIGAGSFVFANFGGEVSSAAQAFFSSLNLGGFQVPLPTTPTGALSFSVEDEKGRPLSGALVSIFFAEKLLATATTVSGEAAFEKVPAKRISYTVSKQGFEPGEGIVDASKKRAVIVTLECPQSGCLSSTPFPTPTPTPAPTPTATPTADPTSTPNSLEKRSLKVSLVDFETGRPILQKATVTVKDGTVLSVIASAQIECVPEQCSNGIALIPNLVVGSMVYVQASAAGYSPQDSGAQPLTLSTSIFANGLVLRLLRLPGQAVKTRIAVVDGANAPLLATIIIFESGKTIPFNTLDSSANGTLEVSLDNVKQWFLLVNKTGYTPAPYATPNFKGGESQSIQLFKFVNQTLQYCRVEALGGGEVGVNEPVAIKIIYANLSAPPSNVTLFCGTDAGQQVVLSTCLNRSGNCTAQCSYGQPGSKAIYAQIGDFNCRSTPVIAINVSTRGPYCGISLSPELISHNGSTNVTISYSNLTSQPPNNILLVTCGSGGASNLVEARNCIGTTGACSTVCRYNFSPSQVLSNPTRSIFVSYGGAQCIKDVRFADTASSLEASVVFRSKLLSSGRVALYKTVLGQPSPVFFTAASAAGGKAFFDQLVRGDSFVVRASDASGILSGSLNTALDLPANKQNVSVDLPPGFFNATPLDATAAATTAQLASANVLFSAFCNDVTFDGSGYTRSFLPRGTCTAVNGACILQASAFVSCFVNGTASNLVDSSEPSQYKVNEANAMLKVERMFSACGGKNQPCCGSTCSSGLACSRQKCTDSAVPTESLTISGSNGLVTSSSAEVVFRVDPVYAADAIPLSFALGPGCSSITAAISGDSRVVACFNDVSLPGTTALKFDSSVSACLVKSSGLVFPNAKAMLSLSCSGSGQKTNVTLKVIGSSSEEAAQYSPASIPASGSASLFYVISQKQLEGQVLELAPGVIASTPAGDSQPPTVSISEPTAGSVVTGPVEITAVAGDERGVESVSFYLDASTAPFKTVSTSPYSVVWDPSIASIADGKHALRAEAKDVSGNSASASVILSKRTETLIASGLNGLNNFLLDSGKLYYAYSGGIGVISSSCPGGCVFAGWNHASQPFAPFVAGASTPQVFFLAYQNSSSGNSSLGVRASQPGVGSLQFFVSNLSDGLSAPFVFADSSNAYYHNGASLLKSAGASVSAVGDLPSPPTAFGFDANAIYVSYNFPAGGRIVKKAYSDASNFFSTLVSTSGIVRSLVVRDGWAYWLEDPPGRACKLLVNGGSVPSCSPVTLTHPSSLSIDPEGSALYFLDGYSIKRIATDWSGYATLATGLSAPKSIAVDSSSVFVSVNDAATGGAIKKVPRSP